MGIFYKNGIVYAGSQPTDLSNYYPKEYIDNLDAEIETELEKGTGILVTTISPTYSKGTIDGVSYTYKVSLSSVKAENNDKTPIVGAYLYYNGYKALYPVVAISTDDDLIYLAAYTSLEGTNGSTPYVNDYGNWHTNDDTGVSAVPQRMSLRKPIDVFFNGGNYFQVEQNAEFSNRSIKKIYPFAGHYLFFTDTGFEIYTAIENDDSNIMSDFVGFATFSIVIKDIAVIYGGQSSSSEITIYATDSSGILYFATLDENSIIEGFAEEIYFQPTGNPASAEQITSLCVCNNKLYCQSANGTTFMLPNMGVYNNGRVVCSSGAEFTISSDGRFIYHTDSTGLTSVSLPCYSDSDMLNFINITGYEEVIDACGICDCNDKMLAISTMGIHWAKNDMLQVFEIVDKGLGSSVTEYQDGVFKPCLIAPSIWNLMETNRASMKSTENFILIFTGSEIILYKKNPFALLGIGNFNVNYGESISFIFETNNKLYIFKKDSVGSTIVYEIALVSPLQPLYKM